MEQPEESKKEIVEESPIQTPPRNINIPQLAAWLAVATASNKGFLLKPTDLRILYMIILWDYLSKRHHQGDLSGEIPAIANDEQISIPEDELVRMVKLIFHTTFYPYFHRVYNM